jgi:hypothetical protein
MWDDLLEEYGPASMSGRPKLMYSEQGEEKGNDHV